MTDEPFQPNVDELLAHNAQYVEAFADGDLSLQPARHLAIVACMDSRMDIFQMLGLAQGDAHVIRNAGGVVTDDVIRSLVLSQRLLGTREIILVHHTNCGLQTITEDAFKAELEAEVGIKPWWALECFTDPYTDTRQSINRLRHSPLVQDVMKHFTTFGSGTLLAPRCLGAQPEHIFMLLVNDGVPAVIAILPFEVSGHGRDFGTWTSDSYDCGLTMRFSSKA